MNSMDLAKQYEVDMKKIYGSLFKETDSTGRKSENYISHVRIIEDAKSPTSRPPPNSPQSNKKNRFLILSIKTSGRMRLHKAKESSNGQIQIGRSWDFDELSLMELDDEVPTGFICQMGKKYYWEVHTPKERRVWCSTLLENYIRYTNGNTPQLINCSVDYFHLENIYDSYHGGPGVSSSQKRNSTPQGLSRIPLSPSRNTSNSFTNPNPQRSPSKSNSQEITSLKRNLGSPIPVISASNSTSSPPPTSPTMAQLARATTAAAISGSANAKNLVNPQLETRNKLESERKRWEEQKQREEQQRIIEAKQLKEQQENERKIALEQRRKQEIEKRRQQELERRKQEELERRKQEELERRKQEELDRREKEEAEKKFKQLQEIEKTKQEEAEKKRIEEQEKIEKEKIQQQKQRTDAIKQRPIHTINPSGIDYIGKRGPPSGMLSNEPSQLSFEVGDESKFQHPNMSIESDINSSFDIDGYISNGEEDGQTAPLNLSKPRAVKESVTNQPSKRSIPVITTTDSDILQPPLNSIGNLSNFSQESEINKLLTPVNQLKEMENNIDSSLGNDERHHARSRAFSRISETTPANTDLSEIFEEINYNPIEDDSVTLQKKLFRELEKLQYDKIQTLTQVTGVSSALKKSISAAFQNCDRIDPILVLFGVQLSTFKDDVDFIEEQGHGLQVEATNEKILINELNEIVHSVEISDSKLQKLLGSNIVLGYQNEQFELILEELYQALLKISDSSVDGDNQLSKMKALQEKKSAYEDAKSSFIRDFKKYAYRIFESVSLSLSSKLQNVNAENFDSTFLKAIFLDKMSNLLTIQGLIAFVKCVSIDDYDEILNSFISTMRPFFDNLTTVLLKELNQQVSILSTQTFSFNSDPSILIDQKYMEMKVKKDFTAKRSASLFSKNTSKSSDDTSIDNELISKISNFLSQIVNVLSIEQELLRNLFQLTSSSDFSFENLVKTPLETRCNNFSSTSNFLLESIETDRDIGDDMFEIMREIFDPTFNASLKLLISVSKTNIIETPPILCILKTFSQSLAPTSQEYLYGNFTKLEIKMNSIWTKEVDQQSQEIMASPLHCRIMNYVKAYPAFYNKIHKIVDSLNLVNIVSFGTDQKIHGNYYVMWDVIKAALNKGLEDIKVEVAVHESLSDDIDATVLIQKHLTLWINYKWIFEETKNLQEFPKDLSKSIDDMRDHELHEFTSSFGRQYGIGKIIRLVDDLENLLDNNGNPANFAAYSVESIKNMMIPFKGDSFKQEILHLANGLKSILKGRCYYVDQPKKENDNSIAIGEQIEKELYNNCMFALCQLYISTFTNLSTIVDKYYNNFE
ncbi:hypothetical protein C6P42_003456, partial [Pichia californica]